MPAKNCSKKKHIQHKSACRKTKTQSIRQVKRPSTVHKYSKKAGKVGQTTQNTLSIKELIKQGVSTPRVQ